MARVLGWLLPWTALTVLPAPQDEAARARPNIVLLISDDQDYEQFGFMGHPVVETPALDTLAAQGTVFRRAYVPPRCRPSLAVLLTGRWPHQNGITFNRGQAPLAAEGSLPNRLADAGYATFLGGKYWGKDHVAMGFQYPAERNESFVREGQADLWAFLDEHAGKQPFFVWWAPSIPHTPHVPPNRHRRKYAKVPVEIPAWYQGKPGRYRSAERLCYSMDAWLDEGVAELVERLSAAGELENTLFLFLVDNGWANGLVSKGSAFEKGVRTPLIVSWPGHVAGGQELEHLVDSVDVFPTLLDYAGLPIPEDLAGVSLRPWIENPELAGRPAIYGAVYLQQRLNDRPEEDAYGLFVSTPEWKYIVYLQDVDGDVQNLTTGVIAPPFRRGRGDEDLFHLSDDPYELTNLAADEAQAGRIEAFRAELLEWWRTSGGGPLELPPR